MSKNVMPESLAEHIMQCLEEYSQAVEEGLCDTLARRAEMVETMLKTNPTVPRSNGRYTGFQKKGSKHYKDEFYIFKRTETHYVIANRQYQLTHLLENGHPMERNGKTFAYSPAFPHWKTAEKAAEKLGDEMKKVIENANRRI